MKKINIFRILISMLFSFNCVVSFGQDNVRFVNFEVSKGSEGAALSWGVEEPLAVNYFEVQASQQGKKYKIIGIVLAPEKEQGTIFEMKYKQINMKRKVFYRVKHVDPEGQASFSEVIKLSVK